MRAVSTKRSGWQDKVWYGGVRVTIADMVNNKAHVCEYDGNSKEGWFVFLRDLDGYGISISPCFGPDTGDTLRDLKAAFARAYPGVKLSKGRSHW